MSGSVDTDADPAMAFAYHKEVAHDRGQLAAELQIS
jgi:hypothetical protein